VLRCCSQRQYCGVCEVGGWRLEVGGVSGQCRVERIWLRRPGPALGSHKKKCLFNFPVRNRINWESGPCSCSCFVLVRVFRVRDHYDRRPTTADREYQTADRRQKTAENKDRADYERRQKPLEDRVRNMCLLVSCSCSFLVLVKRVRGSLTNNQ